jgi:polygalacturonase
MGPRRASPRRRQPEGQPPHRRQPRRQLHPLPHHAQELSQLPRLLQSAGNGFTVWGVKIDTPQRLARNTDGIDPGGGSKNITITHSYFREGDDNVAIKGGGPGELTNMTVSHNHFYWGHGMSIGSETNGGVSKLRVFDLSLDGPDSGIRIKSMGTRGGLVHDAVYDDICIRNSGRPIDITMAYAANGPVKGPRHPPSATSPCATCASPAAERSSSTATTTTTAPRSRSTASG